MGNNESTYIPSDIDQKIQAVNYSVVFGIEIKNSTTHNLHSPKTTIHWGYLLSPPPTSIGPDERGSFVSICRSCYDLTLQILYYLRLMYL